MKIRFVTKDGIEDIVECPNVNQPLTFVERAVLKNENITLEEEPFYFPEYRRYEFRGEMQHGIPTVHET